MILAEPMQLILVNLDTNELIRKKLLAVEFSENMCCGFYGGTGTAQLFL